MSHSYGDKPSTEVPVQVYASEEDEPPRMGLGKYLLTRVPTLVPPMNPAPNPFTALALLSRKQWLFFGVRSETGPILALRLTTFLGRLLRLDLGCL